MKKFSKILNTVETIADEEGRLSRFYVRVDGFPFEINKTKPNMQQMLALYHAVAEQGLSPTHTLDAILAQAHAIHNAKKSK